LTQDQIRIVVDEARAHSLPVIGHLGRTAWREGAELGVDYLTHAVDWSAASLPAVRQEDYREAIDKRGAVRARIDWLEAFDPRSTEADATIAAIVARRIPIDPTLVAYDTKFGGPAGGRYAKNEHVSIVPELEGDWRRCTRITADWSEDDYRRWRAAWPTMLAWVKRLHEEGIVLMTGSDLTNPWVIPGESLHQEFELLHQAGIGNAAILRMTGQNAALSLRRKDIGVIAPGARADLVLLRADPTADISNTRAIVWVMQGGKLVSRGPAQHP
jgi:imidazolonepropionase-like amidohydrolase